MANTDGVIMKNKKIYLILSLVFILLLSFWYVKTPVMTIDKIKEAAVNQDVKTLNKHIDFESLKLSIKLMLLNTGNFQSGKKGKNLSSLVASVFLIPLVEKMLTPESIVLLMSGYNPAVKQESEDDDHSLSIETSWEGLSKVNLKFLSKTESKNILVLVMERDGLHWKLTGIKNQNPTIQ